MKQSKLQAGALLLTDMSPMSWLEFPILQTACPEPKSMLQYAAHGAEELTANHSPYSRASHKPSEQKRTHGCNRVQAYCPVMLGVLDLKLDCPRCLCMLDTGYTSQPHKGPCLS